MTRLLWAFLTRETGAARTEAGFAVAAVLGVAMIAAYLVMSGGPQERAPQPVAPEEVALADLLDGQIRQFSAMQVRQRLATYLDPSDRTDAQLRNAHRTWAERVAKPRYADPDLAHDMVTIIERAMQVRAVRPHAGF
jgi:hypothetical protein